MNHYNNVQLHRALGCVTSVDKPTGLEKEIFAERNCKLEEACEALTNSETKLLRGCVSNLGELQTMLAWVEDRASLRSTRSADSGAKIGAKAE